MAICHDTELRLLVREEPIAAPHSATDVILRLLDGAAADPRLLAALMADPLGMARAAGVRVSGADIKQLLGLAGASDLELIEVLRAHFARGSQAWGANCGCGSSE